MIVAAARRANHGQCTKPVEAPKESRVSGQALARGTLANNLAQVVRIATGVVMVPLVLGRLGIQGYGTFVILMAVFAQLCAPTSGFHWAYSKYTAELEHRGEWERLSGILSAGTILLTVPTAIAGVCCWMFSPSLLPFLGVPAELQSSAATAMVLLAAAATIRALAGVSIQVLAGMQRSDLRFALDTLDALVYFVAAVPFLLAGWGLVALAGSVLLGQIVSLTAGFVICTRLFPAIRLSPFRVRRDSFRQIIGLGGRFQILLFLNEVATSGRAMAIGAVAGAQVVGVFGLAERLIILARTPGNSIVAPLLPAFASLRSAADPRRQQRLLRLASKLCIASVLPVLALICLLGDPLITAWTGESYPDAVTAIRVLALTSLAITVTAVPLTQLRAQGLFELETRMSLLEAVLMVTGAAAGYLFGEFPGLLLTVLAIRVSTRSWFLRCFDRDHENGIFKYLAEVSLRSAAATIPAAIATWILANGSLAVQSHESLPWQLLDLAILGSLFATLTVAASAVLLFARAERNELLALLRRAPSVEVVSEGVAE